MDMAISREMLLVLTMQPIATTIMDLHLDLVMTYTLQTMLVPLTAIIADVPLTEAVTVAATSLQETAISMSIRLRYIMKPFPHSKEFVGGVFGQ